MPDLLAGSSQITDVKVGSTDVSKVYVGNNLVWNRILDTQTVTSVIFGVSAPSGDSVMYQGFSPYSGSISDGTCNFKSGATIISLYSSHSSGSSPSENKLYFELNGNHANSGWTTMTLDGTNYARTSATHNYNGTRTQWLWVLSTNNVFGHTSGTRTVTVTWT